MRTVSVSADVAATPEAVRAELSPRSIVEYEGTYETGDVSQTDDGWLLTAVSVDPDIEMDLRFREHQDGISYELVRGGPFEVLETTLLIEREPPADTDTAGDGPLQLREEAEPDDTVRVTMTSTYTLGGLLSPVVDWLASGDRERELERALFGLAVDVGAIEPPSAADQGSAVERDASGNADSNG